MQSRKVEACLRTFQDACASVEAILMFERILFFFNISWVRKIRDNLRRLPYRPTPCMSSVCSARIQSVAGLPKKHRFTHGQADPMSLVTMNEVFSELLMLCR